MSQPKSSVYSCIFASLCKLTLMFKLTKWYRKNNLPQRNPNLNDTIFLKFSFRNVPSPVCVNSQNMTYISSCAAECQEKVAKNITQKIDFNWLFMFNCNDELINWHLFKGRLIKFVPENVNILNSDLSTYLSFFL